MGHVLGHGGLLHEITEGMKGKPTRERRRFKCYTLWQMTVAMSHSNGQLRTERGGDTEKSRICQNLPTAEDYCVVDV